MPVIKTGTSLTVKPTLNLNFARDKQLDPRITFTRGSNATYYDGYTSVKAEENLVQYSQEFDNNYWAGTGNDRTGNVDTAPDGTATADKHSTAGTGSNIRWYTASPLALTAGQTYTWSFFAKAAEVSWVKSRFAIGGVFNGVWFDLSSGAVGTADSGFTGQIIDVGNGWYRCISTYTIPSTASYYLGGALAPSDNSLTLSSPTAGDGILLWGQQLEQRSSATTYTLTTDAPITKYQPALQTASSNVARFDHNPTTGESLGLLIEEQRTNLIDYSEAINSWSRSASSVFANEAIAPDGTLTADKFALTAGNGYALRSISITSGTSYTYSAYMKKAENDFGMLRLQWNGATYDTVNFNLSNGTTSRTPSGVDSTSIIDVGNGWYRCIVTFTPSVSVTTNFQIRTSNLEQTGSSSVYSGTFNGFNGIYAWGAQVEQASFPTFYIKTTGSQVTRSADITQITGDNFTSFFSSQVGTLLAHFGKINEGDPNIGERLIAIYPDNNIVKYNLEGYRAEVRYLSSWDGQSFNNETRAGGKVAMAFDETGFISASNGVSQGTTTRVPYTNKATKMYIGNTGSGGQPNACIQKIAYYPIRLTSNELQILTSGDVDELNNARSLTLQILDSSGNVVKSIYS